MDINSAFPSKYLKTSDLQGRTVTVTIGQVMMELMADGKTVPVMYFYGKEKGLVLNKTNSNTLMSFFGSDTEAWNSREIILYPTRVQFRDKMVDAIRVDVPKAGAASPQPQQPAPAPQTARPHMSEMRQPVQQPAQPLRDEMNDSIPF